MNIRTVRDLKRVLPKVKRGKEKLPTVKKLSEMEIPIWKRHCFREGDILTVYTNGLVSYVTHHGKTVFRIHEVPDEYHTESVDETIEQIEMLPWEIHLMLVGDDRIFHNDSLKSVKFRSGMQERNTSKDGAVNIGLIQTVIVPSVEEEFFHKDLFNQVYENLTPSQGQIIKLIYEERYKQDEIAKKLNISRSTVAMTHRRALERLRNCIDEFLD